MNSLGTMTFLWPRMLWLLPLLPALALLYSWHDARRRRAAARHPPLQIAGWSSARAAGARRHAAPVLAWLALASLVLAIARPQAMVTLPSRIQTVVLVMDTSGSMKAEDIKPSRIEAARHAARIFLDELPDDVSAGIVSAAGAAAVSQPPTRDRNEVLAVVEHMRPQRGSALGSGLILALATLLPEARIDVASFMNDGSVGPPRRPANPRPNAGARGETGGSRGQAIGPAPGTADAARAQDAAGSKGAGSGVRAQGDAGDGALGGSAQNSGPAGGPGSYTAGAIVLLTDGENNTGPDAVEAARVAADHGVRVYTVGIGTPQGVVITVDGWSARVRLDEASLKNVANLTAGEYFRAEDAAELRKVYRALSARMVLNNREMTEVTALFAALGALLAACAGLLSLWWFGRVL